MAITVKRTKDIEPSELKVDVLVYGPSGSGKTTFGKSFPKPCYIDTNHGLLSVRRSDVHYIECHKKDPILWWNEIREAVEFVKSKPEFETIIIDSLSDVSEAMIGFICAGDKVMKPSYDQWAELKRKLADFVSAIRSCNKNSLFICGELIETDEPTKRVWVRPDILGKTRYLIAYWFDEFYHAEILGGAYKLRARGDSIHTCKSRTLEYSPETHLDPSYMSIKKLLMKR